VTGGKVELDSNGDIERAAFNVWMEAAIEEFKQLENSLEGAQNEHE